MKIWAVANQKGGVGKTTTSISLSGLASSRQQKTLIVDMDPHGSMTSYMGYDPDTNQEGVYQLFHRAANQEPFLISSLIKPTQFECLDILPASTALATLDRQLGTQNGMGLVISRALLSVQDEYEHVFIDCPPMLGILMINALAACDDLLMPVQTEFLALKGLDRMLGTLGMLNKTRKRPLNYTILPTMFDRRTRSSIESLRAIHENYPREKLSNTVIPVDTKFREASRQGKPISVYNSSTKGAVSYSVLFDDLMKLEKVKT